MTVYVSIVNSYVKHIHLRYLEIIGRNEITEKKTTTEGTQHENEVYLVYNKNHQTIHTINQFSGQSPI